MDAQNHNLNHLNFDFVFDTWLRHHSQHFIQDLFESERLKKKISRQNPFLNVHSQVESWIRYTLHRVQYLLPYNTWPMVTCHMYEQRALYFDTRT